MVHNLSDKKTRSGTKANVQAQELNKSVIKKFTIRKGFARFRDNI